MAKLPSLKTLKRRPKRAQELKQELSELKREVRKLEDQRQRKCRKIAEVEDLLQEFDNIIAVVDGIPIVDDGFEIYAVGVETQRMGNRGCSIYKNAHHPDTDTWGLKRYVWGMGCEEVVWIGADWTREQAEALAFDWCINGVPHPDIEELMERNNVAPEKPVILR